MGRKKKTPVEDQSNGEHSDEGESVENVTSIDHQNESVEELVSNYKLVDLKNICRSLNLKVTGNKKPVAERIWNYYHNPQLNDEEQASSPASSQQTQQDQYYQQQQQQQQAMQQYQQQQQLMASLNPLQQQAYLAFQQQFQLVAQQIQQYNQQQQQLPPQLHNTYAQFYQIMQMPWPQQIHQITLMYQQMMQVAQQQQQQQQAQQQVQQQVNGNNDLKRPRENDYQSDAKRLKTSNDDTSAVMGIIKHLAFERQHVTDKNTMVVSLNSVEENEQHITSVVNALLVATMDNLEIIDIIAYVLNEIVDKKILNNYFSNKTSEEFAKLRVLITGFISQFLKQCSEDQGSENDFAKSESVAKIIDLFSFLPLLDYVATGVASGFQGTVPDDFTNHQRAIVLEWPKTLFHLYPEASEYIKNRYETLEKVITNLKDFESEEDARQYVELLKSAKPYFDASALENNLQSASTACHSDQKFRSLWNAVIDTIKQKTYAHLNDVLDKEPLPRDDDSGDQYNFEKNGNGAEHWWLHRYIPQTIPSFGSSIGADLQQQQQIQQQPVKAEAESNGTQQQDQNDVDYQDDEEDDDDDDDDE
jgi:hypothetical protein